MRSFLSPYQQLVLLAALSVDWIPEFPIIPHGVYRALVMRGLLERNRHANYEITAQGRDAIVSNGFRKHNAA